MTDAVSSEGWIAISSAVVTIVGGFLAYASGDKEGEKLKSQAVNEVVGMSVVNQQGYNTVIRYLEDIITRLDRLINVTLDKEGEDLRKHIASDTRTQIVEMLEEIRKRTDDTNERVRKEGFGASRGPKE